MIFLSKTKCNAFISDIHIHFMLSYNASLHVICVIFTGLSTSFGSEIIIYCVCVVCSVIAMISCLFSIRHLRHKISFLFHRNRGRQNITNSTAQVNLGPFEQENSEQFVNHVYEEIDDQIIMPLELIVNRTHIRTYEASSRYIDVIGFTSDYLNPYQPIITYADSHNYATCGLTSCKKKYRNSLPASIECLKYIHVTCECSQRMKDTDQINSTLPSRQCHQMKDLPKNKHDKMNHFCNFKKKRRWSL